MMEILKPSFASPKYWRKETNFDSEWKKLREKILKRDDYTCRYCGFRADKFQIIHHMDGNPENDNEDNLETTCPMCRLILHVGYGCVVQKVVDLYKLSKFSQNEIVIISRKMRVEGKIDEEIIDYLGLKEKVDFRQDKEYLEKLYGFITSREAIDRHVQIGLEYDYAIEKQRINSKQTKLTDY